MIKKTASEKFFEKAIKIIPWGTQTNAKRPVMELAGAMPFYIDHGKGCRIWDIDGREYIDYRCALGSVSLGYCYDEVDNAVKAQMQRGVLFSMASPIEFELAERICRLVPGAEMVRFLKTGGDACSAAVRIARAYSRRYKIISVGYHGWHDTFIVAKDDIGVPAVLKEFVYDVPYGDFTAIEEIVQKDRNNIAAILVEPFHWNVAPVIDYIKNLRKICDENNIVLIFDEILTGFRLALGGAAEYFGIKPDMAVFGKAMANGYPLSTFVGKKEIMSALDHTFITATHAGDTLSIAASLATIQIMEQEPVHATMYRVGKRLMNGLATLFKKYYFPADVIGSPVGFSIKIRQDIDDEKKKHLMTNFQRGVFNHGIFLHQIWFVNYSHTEKDIGQTLDSIEKVLKKLS